MMHLYSVGILDFFKWLILDSPERLKPYVVCWYALTLFALVLLIPALRRTGDSASKARNPLSAVFRLYADFPLWYRMISLIWFGSLLIILAISGLNLSERLPVIYRSEWLCGPDTLTTPVDSNLVDTTYVADTEELLASLGDNRRIVLAGETYDLYRYFRDEASKVNPTAGSIEWPRIYPYIVNQLSTFPHVQFDKDLGLILENLSGVTLHGEPGTYLVTENSATPVLALRNCKEMVICGIHMKHTMQECYDPVMSIADCEDILVEACTLSGSGTVGVDAEDCHHLTFAHNWIINCRDNIISVSRCTGVTSFIENECMENEIAEGGVIAKACESLVFVNNVLAKNGFGDNPGDGALVWIQSFSTDFRNNTITDNVSRLGMIVESQLGQFSNNTIIANDFEDSVQVLSPNLQMVP